MLRYCKQNLKGSESSHDQMHGKNGMTCRPPMLAQFAVSIPSWLLSWPSGISLLLFSASIRSFVVPVPSSNVPWSSVPGTRLFKTGKQPEYSTWVFESWCHLALLNENGNLRRLGTTPISGKTLSEWKGHSRSSGRVPGYSRSSSRNSETDSRNTKFHSRNGIPRLEQYKSQNSRSNSRSDSRNWWEPTWKIFICPCILGAFFARIGVVPAHQKIKAQDLVTHQHHQRNWALKIVVKGNVSKFCLL